MTRDTPTDGDFDQTSRRWVLRASALLGSAAALASFGDAQGTTAAEPAQETPTTTPTQVAETFVIGGRTKYWFGVTPKEIEGVENPTLSLTAGDTYRIVWINLDGVEHRPRILDAEGSELQSTESVATVGETRTMIVEATSKMARYECEFHPQTMRGKISVEGQTETTTPTETTTTTTSDGGGGGGGGYY